MTVKALWVGARGSEIIYPSIVGVFETALPRQLTILSHDHIYSCHPRPVRTWMFAANA